MKIIAITHKGFEDVCSKEIRQLLNKPCTINNRFVECEISDLKELLTIYYKAQSIEFALLKIAEGKTPEEAKNKINEEIKQWIDGDTRFIVRCEREIEIQDIPEIEREVGAKIIGLTSAKVDFRNPELKVIIYATQEKTIIGIDFAVIDLSKRQHKIYRSNVSLKGTLAFCLYKLAGNPKIIIDPFCGSGEIIIEAALHETKKPVNFFQKDKLAFASNPKLEDLNLENFFQNMDKQETKSKIRLIALDKQLRHIRSVKNNAKIAGIDKSIEIARMDTEWLDTKFEKESISHIITQPPELSKTKNEKAVRKILQEFFHQAEFILSHQGRIICINRNTALLKQEAEKQNFKIIEQREAWAGEQKYEVVVFSK